MPKQRRRSTIGAEERLAVRIEQEMKALGWSYARVAAAMRREGCEINASSLYQSLVPRETDEGEPRRRPFYVDELVALARAFRVPVEELIRTPGWVDDERVAKAMEQRDRANRLLETAIRTILDAEAELLRAVDRVPDDVKKQVLDDSARYWHDSTRTMQLVPRGADRRSVTISAEAISDRLASLKEVLSDIAARWHQRERRRRQGQSTPAWPEVGSHAWDVNLAFEKAARDDPEIAKDWRLSQLPESHWKPVEPAPAPPEEDQGN